MNGIDLNTSNHKELKRLHRSMGVAFQNAALFDSLSLEDNVALPLRELTSLDESTIQSDDLDETLRRRTGGLRKAQPAGLVRRNEKRAAVARALALDPEILVFDEPSAGLDPIVAAELDELILALKRAFNMTVLVVTHEMASAFHICRPNGDALPRFAYHSRHERRVPSQLHPRIRQFLDRVPDPILQRAES